MLVFSAFRMEISQVCKAFSFPCWSFAAFKAHLSRFRACFRFKTFWYSIFFYIEYFEILGRCQNHHCVKSLNMSKVKMGKSAWLSIHENWKGFIFCCNPFLVFLRHSGCTHPKVEWGLLTLHLSSARLPELHIAVSADDWGDKYVLKFRQMHIDRAPHCCEDRQLRRGGFLHLCSASCEVFVKSNLI